jgi:ubiquinone/menaquinone biosynthesis C-methylase UbiE
MAIYQRYADVYDQSGQVAFSLKMIPYLQELLQRHAPPGRAVLDLACGTGTVALGFAQQGWEVYGVDGSAAMLAQAERKALETGLRPLFSQQDMRCFGLPRAVSLITCLYDSLNYMLSLNDLQQVLQRVAVALRPGGLLMADMNTLEMLEHVWGDNTFFVEGESLSIVMQSRYVQDTRLSMVQVVGFVRQADERYERFEELHTETAYEQVQIRDVIESAGLRVEASYACFGLEPATEETHRIMWVARKP